MKNYLLLLLIFMISTQTFAEKKPKVDPKDVKIDSLSKVSAALSGKADSLIILSDTLAKQLDSTAAELGKYYVLYETIKERVMKGDFDPTKFGQVIDSMTAGRDSKLAGLAASSVSLADTINTLKQENLKLKTSLDALNNIELAKNRLVSELKQLKELLDAKILTQAEFDAKKTLVLQRWQ